MPAASAVRLVTAAELTDLAGLSYLTLPTGSRAALRPRRAPAPAVPQRPSRRRARR